MESAGKNYDHNRQDGRPELEKYKLTEKSVHHLGDDKFFGLKIKQLN